MDVTVPFDPGAAGLVLVQDSPELASHLSFPFYKPIWASTNYRLAKAMLGHVCFDAAIQLAARVLKAEWAVCGGYALSCQMSASAPHPRKVPVR